MSRKIGTALVVGAGISGIRSALDLAENGYGVTLIDRAPHLGGLLSQLDYQFPTDRCGMCRMLPLVNRDASSQYCLRKGLFHENIDILLNTELISVDGDPGNFEARLRQTPNWVDPALCIGCGLCVDVCPVEVPDDFNEGLTRRKAIYLPVPHNIPNPYIIDFAACTRCGECQKVCPTRAIHLFDQERGRFRILVVDDEKIVRDSLKALMEEEDFRVDTAESGAQALDMLAATPYQLMLTDIKMPGMDGVEVLQKAKELLPDLTVVMMTAYATVETAVEAMKLGALDYLIKPFEPGQLIPMILRIYQGLETAQALTLNVGAVVLSGGTSFYDPKTGKDTLGYSTYPDVVTSLEFERILNPMGPTGGKLVRLSDGRPITRIAWMQCVGSRDLHENADFCSSICCMSAIKEARLAKAKAGGDLDATIYYMDMRTFNKSFQRYRDQAQKAHGIHFQRGRIHTTVLDRKTGELVLRYTDINGKIHEDRRDLLVLSVGQRPIPGMEKLAETLGIDLNAWGFAATEPFSQTRTPKDGIFLSGSSSGLKDISDSVIQASAAALNASRTLHAAGGHLSPKPSPAAEPMDVFRQLPKALVILCTCNGALAQKINLNDLAAKAASDPSVAHVEVLERVCTAEGWDQVVEQVKTVRPNRLLIGSCLPHVYARKLRKLEHETGLSSSLMEVVDLRTPLLVRGDALPDPALTSTAEILSMGLARLKRIEPLPPVTVPVEQRALVVGGGIAGMTAALAVADHGFPVDLIEKEAQVGGNLNWLSRTLEGYETKALFDETLSRIEKNPLIRVHLKSRVIDAFGQEGHFVTSIEDADGKMQSIAHGVTILATGGNEAKTTAYGYGTSPAIVTQKELAVKLEDKTLDPAQLKTVAMIQCVDSREEPRNYCSRICCASSLKFALELKTLHPDIQIVIFYRDLMAYGFYESYYTQARKAGILFIQYTPDQKPQVHVQDTKVVVRALEPIIAQDIEVTADLLVLATGIQPALPPNLAKAYGISLDPDGFFLEADSKWRPVDALKEGVFACGLSHSPRSITESIATAEAAAQRALRILSHAQLTAGKIVATVRHSLCSLCEQCISACPYEARALWAEQEKVVVHPVRCQGCGTCAAVCPNSASVLLGFTEQQMFDVIDAAIGSAMCS